MSEYDRTASTYNKRYREVQLEKYKLMLAGIEVKGKILDHGCGTGLLSEFLNRAPGRAPGGTSPVASLLRPKIRIVGVDNSREMLKIRGSGDLADVEELPYKDNSFDFVLSFTTLQNCSDPEKAIREVKRVLKKNGTFLCTFLSSFKLEPILKKYFKIKEKRRCGEDVGFISFQR